MNIYIIRPKGYNIGNDVILLGIHHFLRLTFQGDVNVISLPATSKYENQSKAGLASGTIYEINQFGNGLIVGGGNLYENGELEISQVALKALECPLMIFGVSRGRIYNKAGALVDRTNVMTDERVAMLNRRADISLSRDGATVEYIRSLGCENELGGCPSLFINEIPQHQVPMMDPNRTDALISIRNPALMSVPVTYQYEIKDQMHGIIQLLRNHGYKTIKIFCHDHRDIPFAASFGDIDYLYTEDVYTYLTYLRNTRLNITYRLHSFIPCLAYDIPAIKISYDERALSMLETLGLDGWNINLVHDDVLKEVGTRLTSLNDLKGMTASLREGRWVELRNTIEKGCQRFYELVSQRGI